MANEISITLAVKVLKGSYAETFNYTGFVSQAAAGAASGVQTVGTSEENLDSGDVANNGLLILRNLDSTNFVDYGMSDAGTMKAVGRIKAGECAMLRVKPAVTVRLKADTASCSVQYLFLEN